MSPTTSVTLPINSYLELCFSRNLGLHFCVHVLSDRFLDLRFHIWDVASDFLTWSYSWRRKLDWICQFCLQCSTRNSTATFFNYSTALIHFFFSSPGHQNTNPSPLTLHFHVFYTCSFTDTAFSKSLFGVTDFPSEVPVFSKMLPDCFCPHNFLI